jgi:DNA-binding PadR family transcriptional regulator
MAKDRAGYARSGLIGLYSLHMMDKSPIYGSDVVHRISQLTNGTWVLGAGALYPTLDRLVEDGYAKVDKINGRKRYTITEKGRRSLAGLRADVSSKARKYMFAWRLVLDLLDHEQLPDFMIQWVKATLSATETVLTENGYKLSPEERGYLLSSVKFEIERFERRTINPGKKQVIQN